MFISEAFAAAASEAPAVGPLGSTLVQLALVLLIFYFFLARPQQKKIREHAEMVEALKKGDKVLTNAGIYGTVSKVEDANILLEVAPNVVITIDRMSVSRLVNSESNEEKSKTAQKSKKGK